LSENRLVKLSSLVAGIVAVAILLAGPAAAWAISYEFIPPSRDLGDLPARRNYAWGIDWNARGAEPPGGEVIENAFLMIEGINDWSREPDDVLHIWLIDELPDLRWRTRNWPGLSVGRDRRDGNVDAFARSSGTFLMDYTDADPRPEDLIVPIPTEVLCDYIANDGIFGFALDPDRRYGNRRVLLRINTSVGQPVPEPVTVVGMFAGLAGLAGYLRRRVHETGRRRQDAVKQEHVQRE